ncbi:MAG: hypothetical protein HWQ41_19345 [Nostoc sp. NOS(2021)]|uniref:hypothetical protein n=1 Tax=Nostoc sp. NOS(2021) TaxID=2815407 RepID=UPI0025FDDD4D|nr:hypothetical protein [Nostoc sp. NOS(2021)]MBN3897351.1 hypothetical protein [Nostoc sp. NOS(2021)]
MTTTIRELLKNLEHHPVETEIVIKDVDDQEFAIADYDFSEKVLTIEIVEKEDEEEEDE